MNIVLENRMPDIEVFKTHQINEADTIRYKHLDVQKNELTLYKDHFFYHISKKITRSVDEDCVNWEEVQVNWRLTMKRKNITSVSYYFNDYNKCFVLQIEFVGTCTDTTVSIYYKTVADGLPMFNMLSQYWLESGE